MQTFVVSKEQIPAWLLNLEQHYDLFGPVRGTDRLVRFQKVLNPESVEWDYTGSVLPPKKYLLPAEELLFTFRKDEVECSSSAEQSKFKILLGLHPCDLHSFLLLDQAMGDGIEDSNYFLRKTKTFFIGVNCQPDDFCFCNSMGTSSPPEKGVDIFLTFLAEKVFMELKSERALPLMQFLSGKEVPSLEEQRMKEEYDKTRICSFRTELHFSDDALKKQLESAKDSALWKELAQRCLSCSGCTAVCPTCFCFDVWDETDLEGSEVKRFRRWDSCQLQDFTKVAGGEIFRKERADRVRHRFFRKFVYLRKRYDHPFCVGCGRCGRVCPTKINIPEVVNELSRNHSA